MDWTNSACLMLISLYLDREVSWNTVHKDYNEQHQQHSERRNRGGQWNGMESLLSSFRR